MRKKVLFLVNHDIVIYNFRLEIVEKLLEKGYEVHISSPDGVRIEELVSLGCVHHNIEIERHGTNIFKDFFIFRNYMKLVKTIEPDILFAFTIKPNIYGGLVSRLTKVPLVANITGLGTALENGGVLQSLLVFLYRIAFKNIQRVFFQNEDNQRFFEKNDIALGKHKIIPGSGVNLNRFPILDYPNDEKISFVFISRIMQQKGIDEILLAAKAINQKYRNIEFHICGFLEEKYEEKIKRSEQQGYIKYHGMVKDIKKILLNMHCTVHPTYYPEGMSNVLLESSASGRPIITTNRSGCREIVDENLNGFLVEPKNTEELIRAIEKFIHLPYQQKKKMGQYGREKVEKEFSRDIVVDAYMAEVENLKKNFLNLI